MKTKIKKIILILFIFISVGFGIYTLTRPQGNPNAPEPPVIDTRIPDEKQIERLITLMTTEEKVGQLFIFGIEETKTIDDNAEDLIKSKKIGNFILMGSNISSETQIKELNKSLQFATKPNNFKIPLLLGVDQEGGNVNRIVFYTTNELRGQNKVDSKELAYKVSSNRAGDLTNLGFNLVFSPVLDYAESSKAFIYHRTFGTTQEKVVEFGAEMVRGYQDHGVIASPKHFLGHPDSGADPHANKVEAKFDEAEIELRNKIFNDVVKESNPGLVMVSHVTYTNLDKDNPCTLSKKCIDLIRDNKDLVLVTDDMRMGAISNNHKPSESTIQAINSGIDIVMIIGDKKNQNEAYNSVLNAVKTGEISEERLNESLIRILKLKQKFFKIDENSEYTVDAVNYSEDKFIRLLPILNPDTNYKFINIYPVITELPEANKENIRIGNYLKKLNFKQTNFGWGNWDEGPRIVNVTYQSENIKCEVQKKYYFNNDIGNGFKDMRIEEEVKCSMLN